MRMTYESAIHLIIYAITPLQTSATAQTGSQLAIAPKAGIAARAAQRLERWQGRRASHLPSLHEPCHGTCV